MQPLPGAAQEGALTFSEVEEFVDDRGKSCLYRLKQMCHELFRNTAEAAYKEKFFDITVGYIFHEAMKLRECIYQLEYYKPQYDMLISSAELTPAEKKVIREFGALIMKAQKRLNEGLKEVRTLLKELAGAIEGPGEDLQEQLPAAAFPARKRKVVHCDVREKGLPGPA